MKKLTLSLLAAGLAALTLASCGDDAVETTAGKTPSGSTPSGSVSSSATTTPVVTTKPAATTSTPVATSGPDVTNPVTPPSTPGVIEDLSYTIDVDLTIVDGNAGIIFSGADASNFVMWQLAIGEYDDGCLWLRPHTWTNGGGRCIEQVVLNDVEGLENVSADYNVKHHMTLRVFDDGVIETLIDGVSVGTTDAAANMILTDGTVGLVGFRCDAYKNGTVPEIGAFDNLKITTAAGEVLYEDDFSSEDSTLCSALVDGDKVVLEDGALKVSGKYLNMVDLGI